jgi:hypothetical protein
VFATCVPLFLFKSDPDLFRCVLIVTVGNPSETPLFSACISAHYGTQQNMSIAKLRIRRLVVRILSGAPHFCRLLLARKSNRPQSRRFEGVLLKLL